MKTIYLAGGCFWGLQKYMDQFPSVKETEVGYANGWVEHPLYPDVKAQTTGHAETVRVVYDEETMPLTKVLTKFAKVIDPTSLNRQGEDVGTSYRTGIYCTDVTDLGVAIAFLKQLQESYDEKVVVEAEMLKCFWPAEEYHQKYLEKNPQGYCHIGGCFFEEQE